MLLRNGKRYNPSQTDMDEKIDLLLKEFQDVKFQLDKVKNSKTRKPQMIVGIVGTITMRGEME